MSSYDTTKLKSNPSMISSCNPIFTLSVLNIEPSIQHRRSLLCVPSATERYHACFLANSIDRFMNTCRRSVSLSCKSLRTSPCVKLIIVSVLTVSMVLSKSSYVARVSVSISDKMPMLSRRSAICERNKNLLTIPNATPNERTCHDYVFMGDRVIIQNAAVEQINQRFVCINWSRFGRAVN